MEFGSDPMGNLLRALPERKQSLFNMLGPTLRNAWVLSNQSNFKKYISKNKQLGRALLTLHTLGWLEQPGFPEYTCSIILLIYHTQGLTCKARGKTS